MALDFQAGAFGGTLLEMTIAADDATLAVYEWVEEGKSYANGLLKPACSASRSQHEILTPSCLQSLAASARECTAGRPDAASDVAPHARRQDWP